jgi:hypothetical protein
MFSKDAARTQLESCPSSVDEYVATFSPREKAFIRTSDTIVSILPFGLASPQAGKPNPHVRADTSREMPTILVS